MAEEQQGKSRPPSKVRTDWARRRTVLSSERTFAAWVRTGLSCISVGLAASKLLGDLRPLWLLRTLAVGLVALGVLALLFGYRSYSKSARDLESGEEHTLPLWWIGTFAAVLTLLALGGLVLVW